MKPLFSDTVGDDHTPFQMLQGCSDSVGQDKQHDAQLLQVEVHAAYALGVVGLELHAELGESWPAAVALIVVAGQVVPSVVAELPDWHCRFASPPGNASCLLRQDFHTLTFRLE